MTFDLIRLRGRWGEADGQQLRAALEHWKRIDDSARDGESRELADDVHIIDDELARVSIVTVMHSARYESPSRSRSLLLAAPRHRASQDSAPHP
jgi:hypothetical protein